MSEKKLFAEFPPVPTSQWEEVITRDLKGADYEKRLQSGKLKCPNFRTIRERIRDYEDEEALPF